MSAGERRVSSGSVRMLAGHAAKVTRLAFYPWPLGSGGGEALLASASDDATIRLWRLDAAGGVSGGGSGGGGGCRVLRGHTGPVDALGWCPAAAERHLLASAAADGSLRLWDTREAAGGRCEAILPIGGDAEHLAWRPDGALLAVATRGDEVLLVAVAGGRPTLLGRTRFALQLNEVVWAPSGLLFACAVQRAAPLDEGHLLVCRLSEDGKGVAPVLQVLAHTMAANAIAFDRSFAHFATGGSDSVVALWEAADVTCVRTFDRNETIVRGVAFSCDSALLAVASDDKLLEIVSAAAACAERRCCVRARACARACATPLPPSLPLALPPPASSQTRVADGSRVRGVPTVDPVNIVAWAPHSLMLAYACEDRLSPRPEHNCVRLLVPA